MKNFEKIEAYFNNELSDSEKNDFMDEIESNTELKSEYNFQKDVINGIKEARKAELKAMLDSVPIATTGTLATGLYKFLAAGAVVVLLGTSIWYYTNSTSKSNAPLNNQISANSPVEKTIKKKTTEEKIISPSKIEEKTTDKVENIAEKEVKKENPLVVTPNLPNSDDPLENETLLEENLNIPEAINNNSVNLSSKINIEIKLKKKYSFHYQYSEKGIVLYGDFEEGLFEILELNREGSTKLYLYYKSNYYYINNKYDVITPLEPVLDTNIKGRLEGLR